MRDRGYQNRTNFMGFGNKGIVKIENKGFIKTDKIVRSATHNKNKNNELHHVRMNEKVLRKLQEYISFEKLAKAKNDSIIQNFLNGR